MSDDQQSAGGVAFPGTRARQWSVQLTLGVNQDTYLPWKTTSCSLSLAASLLVTMVIAPLSALRGDTRTADSSLCNGASTS